MILLYRTKPSQVEAISIHDQHRRVEEFCMHGTFCKVRIADGGGVELLAGKDGAQGWVPVPEGHLIVRNPGDATDLWPVEADYFARKYEPVK